MADPYYLDGDDQPENRLSMVILSQAEDNYFIWKRDALKSLRIRNKIGFVDGTISRPDPSSPLYDAWKKCNEIVTCWLLNSVSKALQYYVFFAETAHQAWVDFRRIFSPSPELKIYDLRRRISMMSQGTDSLACFFGKLNLAWQELAEYDPLPECVCGCCRCDISKRVKEARDKEMTFAFLIGSNNETSITNALVYAFNVDWKIHQLRGNIPFLRQNGYSLPVYFERVNRVWLELSEYDPLPSECTCGDCGCEVAKRATEAREKEKLFGFLMGLDTELSNVKARIRMMNPPPSLNQAYSLLLTWT